MKIKVLLTILLYYFNACLILILYMVISPVKAELLQNTAQDQEIPKKGNYYTIIDLEFLEEERNYIEFFNHARDIRPSNRTEHWKDMVSNMAHGYLDYLRKFRSGTKESIETVEKLMFWPTLVKDEFFLNKREWIGRRYFLECFKVQTKSQQCFKEMFHFWMKRPFPPDVGPFFGQLAFKHMEKEFYEEKIDLTEFYKPAVLGEVSGVLCKKTDIQDYLIRQFSLIVNKGAKGKELKKNIDMLVSKECWKLLIPRLEEVVLNGPGSSKHMAFSLLLAQHSLKQDIADFYHALFILESPIQGDILNESWNIIGDLGLDFKRRQKVLVKLKKMDPLPGKLFSMLDLKKKSVFITHIYQNFPEFIDHYAHTCLDYYSGKKVFENGNPTLYCNDLYSAAKGKDWIDPFMIRNFDKIMTSHH